MKISIVVSSQLLTVGSIYKCSARWIGNHGFSIGIDDVAPSDRLNREKEKEITKGYSACDQHIQAYKKGKLELQPGCNAAQTLESAVTGELNKIREAAGNVGLLPPFFLLAPNLILSFSVTYVFFVFVPCVIYDI